MVHSEMTAFEQLCTQIVPIPKKAEQLEGRPDLKLGKGSYFCLTAPTAEFGPVKTAGEKIEKLLRSLGAEECTCGCGLPVTLSLGEAPAGMVNANEGYKLTISGEGIEIVGYGETGLLYGVITLSQLCKAGVDGVTLPAMEVLDWPEFPARGLLVETRYGSNVMEREDWLYMLEEMAGRKLNYLDFSIYGCWLVQYDNRVSEYLYVPIKKHPELKTPMVVKYWSPEENRWIEYEKLPPIFNADVLDEFFRHARDLGIQVCPAWNSFGHSTFLARNIPEVSAKQPNGEPENAGFCTSNPATYDLLFSIYDQIIDDYMIPYGMHTFTPSLDEVMPEIGLDPSDPMATRSPWCSCPKCRERDRGDILIEHVIRIMKHLKSKGIKNMHMACDMLQKHRPHSVGWLGDRLMKAVKDEGLEDMLIIGWWSYFDVKEKLDFDNLHPELGLRSMVTNISGYYSWSLHCSPLNNIKVLSEMAHRDGGEGAWSYSMWEKVYERNFDAVAEYVWDYEMAGEVQDVTDRYVMRHFGPRAEEAQRAFTLMDLCTEERMDNTKDELSRVINRYGLMRCTLSYYQYTYVAEGKPYPRHFPGEALQQVLKYRKDTERELYSIAATAREAAALFRSIAADSRCDVEMANRFAFECDNYECLVEDWLALLKMYDLTQAGKCKAIAPIARKRQQARLDLMARCEQVKEKFVREALTMRNFSIYMQMFADIAAYVENKDDPKVDLMDVNAIMSDRFWSLR